MKSKIFEIGNPKAVIYDWQKKVCDAWRKCRFLSLIAPRQHGKSHFARDVLSDFVFRFKRRQNPTAAIVMKTAQQAYAVYFAHLDRVFENLPEGIYTKQGSLGSSLRVTLKRTWLQEPDYVTIDIVGAGNPNALRGKTYDQVIADEAGYWSQEVFDTILKPTTDATEGLMMITSTVNGRDQWFYQNHLIYEDMNKSGFSSVNALTFDVYNAGLKSIEWIKTEEQIYKRTGRYNVWLQEYCSDPDANVSVAESPFSLTVNKILDRHRKNKKKFFLTDVANVVYAAVDVGSRGNNPIWEFIPKRRGGAIFLGYEDNDTSQFTAIDRLVKKYPNKKVVLIYPNDVLQPSVMEGVPRIDLINQHLVKMGYTARVETRVLNKTKNRADLVQTGAELVPLSEFNVEGCQIGLELLSKTRMKKETATGFISPKDFAKNGSQHAADAMCYVSVAILMGYTYDAYDRHNNSAPMDTEQRLLKYKY